jgi:acylphosphatase
MLNCIFKQKMNTKSISIKIYGKVQQIGFRYFISKLALEVGVKGFVKNVSDGSVYVEAEGDEHTIDVFKHHCQMGPPHSNVTKFIVNTIPYQGFNEFTIR